MNKNAVKLQNSEIFPIKNNEILKYNKKRCVLVSTAKKNAVNLQKYYQKY